MSSHWESSRQNFLEIKTVKRVFQESQQTKIGISLQFFCLFVCFAAPFPFITWRLRITKAKTQEMGFLGTAHGVRWAKVHKGSLQVSSWMFLSDISGSCFPRKKGDFSLSVAQCRLPMCRKKTEEGSKERWKGGREGSRKL